MNNIRKKWTDFSTSETKPLFWMLFGPIFMLLTLTLALPHFSKPLLPLISAGGLILSWRFRVAGFSLTLILFTFYFAFTYFFGHQDVFLWKVSWGISLALGLTISFLSMEELRCYYAKEKVEKEKALKSVQHSFECFQDKAAIEKRIQEKEGETIREELESSRSEVEAILGLVEASQIESDKIYKQNISLSKETLEMHREIEQFKMHIEEEKKEIDILKKEHKELSEEASNRLKTLNIYRTELYQVQLLNDGYQKQLKKAREYFLAQKKSAPQEMPVKEKSQHLILQTLEKDKGMIKKIYDQILEDYKKVKGISAPDEVLILELKEKKKKLEQTKSELIGIEREIFMIKKGLQEKGAYP